MLNKLSPGIVAVTQLAGLRTRFTGMRVDALGTTRAQLTAIMHAELEKWKRVIRAASGNRKSPLISKPISVRERMCAIGWR